MESGLELLRYRVLLSILLAPWGGPCECGTRPADPKTAPGLIVGRAPETQFDSELSRLMGSQAGGLAGFAVFLHRRRRGAGSANGPWVD